MDQLTAARIQTVRDHMRLECEGDWDGVIATFEHPRYELYGAGTVFDGEDAVRGYFAASRTPFPDQANEIIAIGAGGDTVLVEFWLTGTHLGPLRHAEGRDSADRKGVSRAHDGQLRVRAGLGQDRLRAAVFRPARGDPGAGVELRVASRVPDAVRRSSRRSAEPGPYEHRRSASRPRLSSVPRRQVRRAAHASGEHSLNSSSCRPARPS